MTYHERETARYTIKSLVDIYIYVDGDGNDFNGSFLILNFISPVPEYGGFSTSITTLKSFLSLDFMPKV